MNSRNKILLTALAVQLAIVFFVYRDNRPAIAEHFFFPALAPDEIRTMTITDENGGMIRLTRKEQGWMITETSAPEGGGDSGGGAASIEPPVPADDAKVQAFIQRMAQLKSDRLVSRTRTSQVRLKVAEEQFARRIELATEAGRSIILFLGSSPSFKTIHLRAGSENEVYLAEGLTTWETNIQLSTWWENDYLDLEPEELQVVTLTNAHGRLRLIRDENSGWRLDEAAAGEQVSAAAVEEFLYRTGYISLLDYLGREGNIAEAAYGLDKPAATIILDNGDRETEVRIGQEQEESGQRVVKSSASPFYVKVPSYSLQTILEQKRADLLIRDDESETPEGQKAEKAEPERT